MQRSISDSPVVLLALLMFPSSTFLRQRIAIPYQESGTLLSGVSSKVKPAMSKASLYAELYSEANISAITFKLILFVSWVDCPLK